MTSSRPDEVALIAGAPRTCSVAVGPARAGRFRRLQLQTSDRADPIPHTGRPARQSSAPVIATDDAAETQVGGGGVGSLVEVDQRRGNDPAAAGSLTSHRPALQATELATTPGSAGSATAWSVISARLPQEPHQLQGDHRFGTPPTRSTSGEAGSAPVVDGDDRSGPSSPVNFASRATCSRRDTPRGSTRR
jgi:hypothetical protein